MARLGGDEFSCNYVVKHKHEIGTYIAWLEPFGRSVGVHCVVGIW